VKVVQSQSLGIELGGIIALPVSVAIRSGGSDLVLLLVCLPPVL